MPENDRAYWRATCDHGIAELWLPRKLSVGDAADLHSLAMLIERYVNRCIASEAEFPTLLDCKGVLKDDPTD